jgi:hypothetical protein
LFKKIWLERRNPFRQGKKQYHTQETYFWQDSTVRFGKHLFDATPFHDDILLQLSHSAPIIIVDTTVLYSPLPKVISNVCSVWRDSIFDSVSSRQRIARRAADDDTDDANATAKVAAAAADRRRPLFLLGNLQKAETMKDE